MSTVGIIAEFNPYHTGHQYLLNTAKAVTKSDTAVIVMSENFVQRGEMALLDSYTRASMAIKDQADLIFGLPTFYSLSSSHDFAMGGVSALEALGVDYLAFGAETDDLHLLQNIAHIISQESKEFKDVLNKNLANGQSYPAARQAAILSQVSGEVDSTVISSPNNILAIEYLSAIELLGAKIKPVVIKRKGAGINDALTSGKFPGATALREAIINGQEVNDYLPESSQQVFDETCHKLKLNNLSISEAVKLRDEKLSLLFQNFISDLKYDLNDARETMDLTDALVNRAIKLDSNLNYPDYLKALKTANITMGRIKRIFCRYLLHITNTDNDLYRSRLGAGKCVTPYVKLLAMKKSASPLLKVMNQSESTVIINKRADYETSDTFAAWLWKTDSLAADLYHRVCELSYFEPVRSEIRTSPIIYSE